MINKTCSVLASILLLIQSTVAHSSKKHALAVDFNFGGGFASARTSDDSAVGLGVFTNAELAGFTVIKKDYEHVLMIDTAYRSLVGFASSSDSGKGNFLVHLDGHIEIGMQAFRFFPLNFSAQDIAMDVVNGETTSRALVGTSFYPFFGRFGNSSLLIVSTTIGSRRDDSGRRVGYQLKAHAMNDDFSFEWSYLYAHQEKTTENQMRAQIGVNHLLGKGSQLGLAFRANQLAIGNSRATVGEGMTWFGINL